MAKAKEPKTPSVTLSNLQPAAGSTQSRKRHRARPGLRAGQDVGQGPQGHKARTGGSTNPGFEGGQMPMYRRLPKRGFTNPFKVTAVPVNLARLAAVTGGDVTPEALVSRGDHPEPRRWWSRSSAPARPPGPTPSAVSRCPPRPAPRSRRPAAASRRK